MRIVRALDRWLCLAGGSCCVARSQGAWDRIGKRE